MPVRKRKPAEANDGSYAGLVLAAWDRLYPEDTAKAITPEPPHYVSNETQGDQMPIKLSFNIRVF